MWDFLFRYYSLRPRQLRVWHPGFGVVLGGPDGAAAGATSDRTGYGPHRAGVTVTDEHLRARVDTVRFIAELLRATASRSPRLNCFGLHEWAMVYRAPAVRHERVPLRLGAAATDARRRVDAVALQPLRRVPVLHRARRARGTRVPRRAATSPAGNSRAASTPTWTSTSGATSWGR